MPTYSAESVSNESKRSNRVYSDLDLDFQMNTVTKDVPFIKDIEAVKRSVKNLIQTNYYERPFRPELGGNLRAMLFENISPQISHMISKLIENLIVTYEPRVNIIQVMTRPNLDRNAYSVTLSFYVLNHPEPVAIETMLERLR
jgi:phage baseplate assembly protein W|tara:strand:- start:1469 stop:1897 length:429 start_codon:yes stop_codon:yes gene_type:complete